MGKQEVEVTGATTEKWSLHCVRSVAQLASKARGRKKLEAHTPAHTCSGPSFLHNLLPILEPFLLLDPKLLYIEDRIIGRQQAPRSGKTHKVPSNIEELRTWVANSAAPCDCDECAPWLYQLGVNSSHGAIRYQEHDFDEPTRFCNLRISLRYRIPKLNLRMYGEYESMRLVRHHTAWLDKTYMQSLVGEKRTPVLQLQSLMRSWKPNLTGRDMRATMSSAQSLQIIKLLNKVFFFGAIPSHRESISSGFSWLPDSEKACFGVGTFNPIIGTQILLHPTLYRNNGDMEDLDARWRNRLGTILHELCHAFLKAYTCRSCPTHDHCIGPRGHGRAWQILVAKMEEVATRLMGGFVDMGRYPSLLHDLEDNGKLPSAHDLDFLKFGTRWPAAQQG
jgi:hypothetical protein